MNMSLKTKTRKVRNKMEPDSKCKRTIRVKQLTSSQIVKHPFIIKLHLHDNPAHDTPAVYLTYTQVKQ